MAMRWRHSCFAREPFWPVAADTLQRLSIHERFAFLKNSFSLSELKKCGGHKLGKTGDA